MDTHARQIAKDASIVGAATLLSRILGFFRDVIVAYVLGAGLMADAFYVAYRLPNMLRRLFAEGSMTMAFVPVFSRLREEDGYEAAQAMSRSAMVWLLLILSLITALAMIFAKPLVLLIAPGFVKNPEQLELTVELVRIVFPYIIQISAVALCMGILNSMGHFLAPALATSELNTVIIMGVGVAWLFNLDVPHTLAWSILAGGLMQWQLQQPYLKKFGFSWRGAWKFADKGVGRMGKLMLPTAFGAAVYQVNIALGTLLASLLQVGSISYLYYADRLVQFPLGVFGAAVGTVALPSLSRLAAAGKMEEFRGTINSSLRLTLFICLPATAGLIALAEPMTRILFGRGAFTPEAVQATALAIVAYGVGLPAFAGVKPIVSAYYAVSDTRTPVYAAVVSMVLNVALGYLLMQSYAHVGLALATSISSWVNMLLLGLCLRRRIGPWLNILRSTLICLLLSSIVGAGAWFTAPYPWLSLSLIPLWAVFYMACALGLKVEEASTFYGYIRRRLGRKGA